MGDKVFFCNQKVCDFRVPINFSGTKITREHIQALIGPEGKTPTIKFISQKEGKNKGKEFQVYFCVAEKGTVLEGENPILTEFVQQEQDAEQGAEPALASSENSG